MFINNKLSYICCMINGIRVSVIYVDIQAYWLAQYYFQKTYKLF